MGENGLRPFHETVAEAIMCASDAELLFLGRLLKTTKIPKNHDYIIMVWNQRMEEMFFEDDFGVTESLLAQKESAENKTVEKKQLKVEVRATPPLDRVAVDN